MAVTAEASVKGPGLKRIIHPFFWQVISLNL